MEGKKTELRTTILQPLFTHLSCSIRYGHCLCQEDNKDNSLTVFMMWQEESSVLQKNINANLFWPYSEIVVQCCISKSLSLSLFLFLFFIFFVCVCVCVFSHTGTVP